MVPCQLAAIASARLDSTALKPSIEGIDGSNDTALTSNVVISLAKVSPEGRILES